jgi:hypothetical protein
MEVAYLILIPLLTVATLAIYWTLFKARKEVVSALLEILKVLEKK